MLSRHRHSVIATAAQATREPMDTEEAWQLLRAKEWMLHVAATCRAILGAPDTTGHFFFSTPHEAMLELEYSSFSHKKLV